MKRAILITMASLVLYACGGDGGESVVPPAEAATDTFLKSIVITTRTATDSDGVAYVYCQSNENVVGGGAYCSGNARDNEAGYLFTSKSFGNAFIGACYPSTSQEHIPIEVFALCASGVYGEAVVPKAEGVVIIMPGPTVEGEEVILRMMIEAYKDRMY